MNVRQITRIMTGWRDEPPQLHKIAPGEPPQRLTLAALQPVLTFLGSAVGGGVTGNAAYDLLKAMGS
jgi:hypothetical protein